METEQHNINENAAITMHPGHQEQDSHSLHQFLTFTLGDEEYGVDIMQVREVKGWTDATRLPNSPVYVRGVLNLRGMILPIFDLRTRFTGELTEATPKHVIVIIAVGERIIGVLADSVSDIITVNEADIKPAPETDGQRQDLHFIDGLIALEDRMVVLLDMEQLIGSDSVDALVQSAVANNHQEPVKEEHHA